MAEEKGRLSGGKKGIEVSSEVMDKINGPAKKRMKSENNGAYSIVRDVPSYILQIARAAFPKARNNTDALVAYLAIMCLIDMLPMHRKIWWMKPIQVCIANFQIVC